MRDSLNRFVRVFRDSRVNTGAARNEHKHMVENMRFGRAACGLVLTDLPEPGIETLVKNLVVCVGRRFCMRGFAGCTEN